MGVWAWILQEIKGWDLHLMVRSWRGKLSLADTRGLFFLGGGLGWGGTLDWQSPRGTVLVLRSAWNTD